LSQGSTTEEKRMNNLDMPNYSSLEDNLTQFSM